MKPNDPLEPLPPHDEDKDRTRWIWIVVTIAVTALVVLYLLIRTNAIQEGGIIEGRIPRTEPRPKRTAAAGPGGATRHQDCYELRAQPDYGGTSLR